MAIINDRFKFRVWHKKRKKMYEVLHLHIGTYSNGGDWATVKGFNIITQQDIHIQVQPKDCLLMQCTGLKDKNGKFIYEGDIVQDKSEHIRVCVYEIDCFKYPALKTSRYFHRPISNKLNKRKNGLNAKLTYQDHISKKDKTEFKVIGNIYENEELLQCNI